MTMKIFIATLVLVFSDGVFGDAKRDIDDKRTQQEKQANVDHTHLLYMNLKLDDIADTLKDMQKPCPETADSDMYEKVDKLQHEVTEVTKTISAIMKDVTDMNGKMNEMKDDLTESRQHTTSKYHELRTEVNDMKESLNENRQYATSKYHELRVDVNDNLEEAHTKHREFRQSYHELKQNMDGSLKISGTTYIRWGRSTCPGNGSELTYSGYAGGSLYDHKGAAASLLCLPTDPDWAKYTNIENIHSGFIYGAEYEPANGRTDQFFGNEHAEQDVPCVVCNVKSRSSNIMIPGKTSCYMGWTLEYSGYLMTGYYDHPAARDYYCIDKDAETLPGGAGNDNGYLLYFVEARCGSLKCPPYVNGRELPCVVCSK